MVRRFGSNRPYRQNAKIYKINKNIKNQLEISGKYERIVEIHWDSRINNWKLDKIRVPSHGGNVFFFAPKNDMFQEKMTFLYENDEFRFINSVRTGQVH